MITAEELRHAVPELAQLPQATLAWIAQLAVERRYAPKQNLYRAGDEPADGLYFVLGGKVLVSREHPSSQQMLHTEGAGGVLGEIPVFGGGPFPATATAVERTRCAHLPSTAVERLLSNDPAFARFALRRLALRARSLLRRIDELTASTITARLARYVADRAERLGPRDFTLGMSQEALAAEFGTAREVIVRALSALVAAQAIQRTGRSRFAVHRPSILRAMAEK